MTVLSLVTAVVLNRPIRGRGFYRAVFFFPVMLSPVVVALIWKWILQRQGLLNAGLVAFHQDPIEWLNYPQSAFFWSVFITIWARMGFYTLILLAGLQAIPRDVYEAARMDSATPWRVFTRITLPLLRPTMLVVVVLALISRRADLRRALRAHRRRAGLGDRPADPVHLSRPASRPCRAISASPPRRRMLVGGVLLLLTLIQLRFAGRSYDG